MDVRAFADGPLDFRGTDFSILTAEQKNFAAVGKEFRGTAFRNLYVRQLVAQHAVIRLAE